jgi:hypothetical protein
VTQRGLRFFKAEWLFVRDSRIANLEWLCGSQALRVVNAVYFCANKLEAFSHRGKGDYFSSHDLEDLLAVVDGRPGLADGIQASPSEVRGHIAGEFQKFLTSSDFMDALPGDLLPPDAASQAVLRSFLSALPVYRSSQAAVNH